MPPAWLQVNEAIEELASLDRSLGCNDMVTYISPFAQKEHETAKIVSLTIDDFTLFDVYPFSIFSSGSTRNVLTQPVIVPVRNNATRFLFIFNIHYATCVQEIRTLQEEDVGTFGAVFEHQAATGIL